MLILFIVLAAIGFLAAIGGGIWWVVSSGKVEKRSGPQAGAEVMAGIMDEEDDGGEEIEVFSASKQVFVGTGAKVEGSAEISFAEIKQQARAGGMAAVLPAVVASVGLLAVVVFGALALFVGIDDKLLGGAIVAVALYTVGRLVYGFVKA